MTRERLQDGWLHADDMEYLDENGYLRLSDRKTDMIITGGEHLFPTEAENMTNQLPAVLTCSVA